MNRIVKYFNHVVFLLSICVTGCILNVPWDFDNEFCSSKRIRQMQYIEYVDDTIAVKEVTEYWKLGELLVTIQLNRKTENLYYIKILRKGEVISEECFYSKLNENNTYRSTYPCKYGSDMISQEKYDSLGRIVESFGLINDSIFELIYEYEYDDANRRFHIYSYADGKKTLYSTTHLNEKGDYEKIEYFKKDEATVLSHSIYRYYSKYTEVYHYDDSKLESKTRNYMNSHGLLKQSIVCSESSG